MTFVDIDHQTIKKRIKLIIDTKIATLADDDDSKLRNVIVGRPSGPREEDGYDTTPFAYITQGNPIRISVPTGIVSANERKALKHTIRYAIGFVVQGKDSEEAERIQDGIEKLLFELFNENEQLTDPSSGNDPLVDFSLTESVNELNFSALKGADKQGRILVLKCVVTTGS
ncbi:hypothetical protein K0U27_00730 [archaeon]|nr:hypothetical protein [archaeon]